MTKCKDCGQELPDEQAECPVCATLDLARDDDGEEDGKEDDEAADEPVEQEDASDEDEVAGEADAEEPVEQDDGDQTSEDDLAEAAPALPSAPNEAASSAEKDSQAEAAQQQNAKGEYGERFEKEALKFGSDAFIMKRIGDLKKRNIPAALFLGVRTTGKTWLMQRMKAELEDTYDCVPPLALSNKERDSETVQQLDREAEQKQAAKEDQENESTPEEKRAADERKAASDTGRTDAIIFHRFIGPTHSFALIDVPGERIERLVEGNYSDLRGLLAALDYAKAIILALPADVVLLGGQCDEDEDRADAPFVQFKEDVQRLNEFTNAIGTIAAVRSLAQHKKIDFKWKDPTGPKDQFDLEITPDAVQDHREARDECLPIGGHDGKQCPAFFALTKADRVFATLDVLPDAAFSIPDGQKQFDNANEVVRDCPEGNLLQEFYRGSPLNPAVRPPDNDIVSRIGRLIWGSADRATEISNPPDLVRSFNRKLFNRLTVYLPMSRFDLISAFYGNTKKSLRRSDLKRMESVGVSELIQWLGELHDKGIDGWHVWARSVFRRVYGSADDQTGPFGGMGVHAASKRLNWTPRGVLKRMFRKEWHPAQAAPWVLGLVGALGMFWSSFDLLEGTGRFADGKLYEEFQRELDLGANDGTVGAVLPAITALPAVPREVDRTQAARWSPIGGLAPWDKDPQQGSYKVRAEYAPVPDEEAASEELRALREQQSEWQSEYVCGLKGWDRYRSIVRKAVINGFGDCSTATKLALRSPAIERFGGLVGLLLLLIGWAIVGGVAYYYWWFLKTRSAYAWLYHSNAATTRRTPKPGG